VEEELLLEWELFIMTAPLQKHLEHFNHLVYLYYMHVEKVVQEEQHLLQVAMRLIQQH
jgi:hypothetical protein